MKKVLDFLKQNATFFVISAIVLVFYFIAIFGGDYQTIQFRFEVTHYTFLNGLEMGLPLAFLYVLVPVLCLAIIAVLFFLKPKKRDGKKATIFVSSFIILATIAGVFIGLIPVALFNEADKVFYKLSDWTGNTTIDAYYFKSFNFPYLSMVFSLFATIVLGCYSAATLSD